MPQIVASRCVLAVPNLAASTRFYMDVLGFTRDFGDGTDGWSFLSRDHFRLALGECPDAIPPGDLGDHSYFVYLTIEGLDDFHDELSARGVEIISRLQDKPWGQREFGIRTPDGHRIMLGAPIGGA